jgi:hypothetical protein
VLPDLTGLNVLQPLLMTLSSITRHMAMQIPGLMSKKALK